MKEFSGICSNESFVKIEGESKRQSEIIILVCEAEYVLTNANDLSKVRRFESLRFVASDEGLIVLRDSINKILEKKV